MGSFLSASPCPPGAHPRRPSPLPNTHPWCPPLFAPCPLAPATMPLPLRPYIIQYMHNERFHSGNYTIRPSEPHSGPIKHIVPAKMMCVVVSLSFQHSAECNGEWMDSILPWHVQEKCIWCQSCHCVCYFASTNGFRNRSVQYFFTNCERKNCFTVMIKTSFGL